MAQCNNQRSPNELYLRIWLTNILISFEYGIKWFKLFIATLYCNIENKHTYVQLKRIKDVFATWFA